VNDKCNGVRHEQRHIDSSSLDIGGRILLQFFTYTSDRSCRRCRLQAPLLQMMQMRWKMRLGSTEVQFHGHVQKQFLTNGNLYDNEFDLSCIHGFKSFKPLVESQTLMRGFALKVTGQVCFHSRIEYIDPVTQKNKQYSITATQTI